MVKVVLIKNHANIDDGVATANTTFGAIGVKVWIYNGDIIARKSTKEVSSDVNA